MMLRTPVSIDPIALNVATERSRDFDAHPGQASAMRALTDLPLAELVTVTVLPHHDDLEFSDPYWARLRATTYDESECLVPHAPVVPSWVYHVALPE